MNTQEKYIKKKVIDSEKYLKIIFSNSFAYDSMIAMFL